MKGRRMRGGVLAHTFTVARAHAMHKANVIARSMHFIYMNLERRTGRPRVRLVLREGTLERRLAALAISSSAPRELFT